MSLAPHGGSKMGALLRNTVGRCTQVCACFFDGKGNDSVENIKRIQGSKVCQAQERLQL
eukprot:CAMPEP_0197441470 /NCGR_PEP_ID=MMETSP1175-20131217/7736_1 /TAXON_ID=1003142 /ORGANISM="Triceratium dubium, Strain CCMP147" /LENGTH=58 /DNA_ID=CAMNT_0042971749 /DNA_START=688 /DNA_END=864 /DNA_ORIENTATION=+